MLLALVTGQRGQTLHLLTLGDVSFPLENMCSIKVSAKLKQTRPGVHLAPIELNAFSFPKLSIVTHLQVYIERTKDVRSDEGFFIGCVKPHKHVSRDTISRWIKVVLKGAGIDFSVWCSQYTSSKCFSSRS